MTFYRGQRVVYIGEAPFTWSRWWTQIWHPEPADDLVEGRVYQIENITDEGQLELVGVASPGDDYWCEGFLPQCFRPAVDRKTDISVFKEIARKATRKQGVDA